MGLNGVVSGYTISIGIFEGLMVKSTDPWCKTREKYNFSKKSKMVILVENLDFFFLDLG